MDKNINFVLLSTVYGLTIKWILKWVGIRNGINKQKFLSFRHGPKVALTTLFSFGIQYVLKSSSVW